MNARPADDELDMRVRVRFESGYRRSEPSGSCPPIAASRGARERSTG
jgi:hypothetical protein